MSNAAEPKKIPVARVTLNAHVEEQLRQCNELIKQPALQFDGTACIHALQRMIEAVQMLMMDRADLQAKILEAERLALKYRTRSKHQRRELKDQERRRKLVTREVCALAADLRAESRRSSIKEGEAHRQAHELLKIVRLVDKLLSTEAGTGEATVAAIAVALDKLPASALVDPYETKKEGTT